MWELIGRGLPYCLLSLVESMTGRGLATIMTTNSAGLMRRVGGLSLLAEALAIMSGTYTSTSSDALVSLALKVMS